MSSRLIALPPTGANWGHHVSLSLSRRLLVGWAWLAVPALSEPEEPVQRINKAKETVVVPLDRESREYRLGADRPLVR